MTKRLKLLLLVVVIVLGGASLSYAYPDWGPLPAYYTRLYSDATHQTQVGYIYPECHFWYGIWYHLVGTYSQYAVDEYVGTCIDGEMYP